MKGFAAAVALSLVLGAAPSFAQAPAPRPAAPATQTAPATPRPAPQTAPAPAAAAPAPAAAPRPFPEGVKYAFIYVQKIATESAEGKVSTDKVRALNEQKQKELQAKNVALQTAQQKLEQGGSVLNEVARAQLATDIERQQKELQRATEDAQQELQRLQQQLQEDFQRKLTPVIQKVAVEYKLHMIFSVTDSGLVWGDPSLDLTDEIIQQFNSTTAKPAAR